MANSVRLFVFVKDMPYKNSTIQRNTRLSVYANSVSMDGMLLSGDSQRFFRNLIDNELANPNYLREVKV